MNNDIKIGATLYSFFSLWVSREKSFEEIVALASELGYEGVELVGAQMAPGYPDISDEWIESFKGLLEKNNLKLVTWSAYIDRGIRSDRDLSRDEVIKFTKRDLIQAKKAGAKIVRTQFYIGADVLREMIPFCRQLGVKLAVELHAPHNPHLPEWQEILTVLALPEAKDILGVIPDFSIFQNSLTDDMKTRMTLIGFSEADIRRIEQYAAEGKDVETMDGIARFSAEQRALLEEVQRYCCAPCRLEDLELLLPYTPYIHGKFHHINENLVETTKPYEKIIRYIRGWGYKGYIASEYEGAFDDCLEQQRRYAKMLDKYLA